MRLSLPTGGRGTRRWVLGLAVGAAAVAVTAPAIATTAAALPTVNMEKVLQAAQIDPPRSGTGLTPGAKDYVIRVERALNAKGLLARRYVDGHYGSSTVSAYAAWQRRLGYSGIGANGIPGRTSLKKLGERRFTVTRIVSTGSTRSSWSGKRINYRTYKMMRAADRKVPWSLRVTQGSYSTSVGASAGTHAGGGAVDISVRSMSTTQRWRTVKALRTVGFAAWLRTPSQGDWPYHIHAIAISDPDLSKPARNQVHDYYFGKNGLRSHAADNTPRKYRVAFTWWEKYLR
ncbi:MAG: peptidoglycan-binding protein [Micromonosporaceae bacterium]